MGTPGERAHFLSCLGKFPIRYVSWCILRVSWRIHVSWCILMYTKRILQLLCYIPREYMYLDILHVFYHVFQRSKDTYKIHKNYMYLMRFLDVTLDTYQDTSRSMYLGLFITIHQDTPRYKIMIHVSWTRHDDTSRYKHTIRIHKGYIRDTCGIHAGYMYLQRFEDTCRIHTWYMQD